MLKIFGDIVSSGCLMVKWRLDHLKIDYQRVEVARAPVAGIR